MIKSAIKHSAIRSAISKPFVPGDDGYREYIKRSVPEFDGTQYGIFTNNINLSQGCKISFLMATTSDLIHVLMSFVTDNDTGEYFRIGVNWQDNDGYLKIETAGHTPGIGTILVTDGKLHKIDIDIPIDGSIKVYVDGVLDYTTQHTNLSLLNRDFDVYLSQGRSHNAAIPYGEFIGVLSDLSIVDSDGLPIPGFGDIQLDERDTDYQRNRAVSLGQELAGTTPPTAAGSTWEDLGMGQYRATSDGSYLTIKWNCTQGKHYLVSYDIEYLGGGGIRLNSATDITPWDFSSTDRTVVKLVVADGDTIGFKHDNSCDFIISNISIREWSGAILQNFVHGDGGSWLDIERKRYWDYWLGPELSPNVTFDNNADGWELDAPYWVWENGRVLCENLNSYNQNIKVYGIFSAGFTYQVSYNGYASNGAFGMQNSDNRVPSDLSIRQGKSTVFTDYIAGGGAALFKRSSNVGSGWIDNISFRRKLEIAQ